MEKDVGHFFGAFFKTKSNPGLDQCGGSTGEEIWLILVVQYIQAQNLIQCLLIQKTVDQAVKNVMEVLTGRGIEEKSICMTYYSMYPQYDWSDGEQRITRYNVTTTMTVQDQNIKDLGTLLSACMAAGINNVDNVSFFCSSYDEAYRQALAQAVADSRLKAEALAQAAGKTLGEPVTITEGWQDTSARYGRNAEVPLAMSEAAAQDSAGPSLQPGETEITANVTVTYRIN